MRYPAAETAEKHGRILEEAARLFRERGFEDVSVSEIMKATGLTHGPFYNHFASKEALMAESIEHASAQFFENLLALPPSAKGKADYLSNYLSAAHRDNPAEGCLTAALATEIGREPAVRKVFTAHVKASIEKLASYFPWSPKRNARGHTIRMMASTIGALILARAVDDERLSEEILREVRRDLS
jgi:TetR/AcrR family transcriptional repressor of nem operon